MPGKNLFITGGSGYIGSRVVAKAVARGYTVRALSRTTESDAKIKALGAVPVRGDLKSLSVLASEAGLASVVINIAFDFIFGTGPEEMATATLLDIAVIDTICAAMQPGSVFVMTTGALVTAPDPAGGEVDEEMPRNTKHFAERGQNEVHALAKAGVHNIIVNVVRPAAFVYGRQGSGVAMLMRAAAKNGAAMYIDEGSAQVSSVHVDDCAEEYMLVAEKHETGIYNAVSNTTVSFKQLAEAVGKLVGVPAVSVPKAAAEAAMGPMMTMFLSTPSRATGRKAKEQLGWNPEMPSLLEDIEKGSYVELAKTLKA